GEQQVSPEEKLLKVIFGKKAEEVSDASLVVPPGTSGKILAVEVFVRRERMGKKEDDTKKKEIDEVMQAELGRLREERKEALAYLEKAVESKEMTPKAAADNKEELLELFEKK